MSNQTTAPTLYIDQTNAHQSDVNCVGFTPSGFIVSGSGDKSLRIWRISSDDKALVGVHHLKGHKYSVNSVSLSPGGTLLCSGSTDGTSLLWDTRSGGAVASLVQPSGAAVRVVSFSPGPQHLVATAGDDEEVCLWDVSTGQCVKRVTGHQATVFAVAWSPDGDLLVTSDTLGRVRAWSSVIGHSERLAGVEEAHDLGVTSLCFSPIVTMSSSLTSEYSLLSCGNDGDLALWSIVSGVQSTMQLTKRQLGHQGAAMAVAVSADGQLIASAGGDKLVKLWSPDLTQLHELSGHDRYVTSVAFSGCGQYLASGSNDKSIKVWSLVNKDPATSQTSFSHTSHQSRSETMFQTKLTQCQQRIVQTLSSHSLDVTSCDIGGQYLVTGCSDGLVRVWQCDDQQYNSLTTLTGHTYSVYSVRLASDNMTVVSASLDGVVIIWTLPGGELTRSWRHPGNVALRVVRMSGDGNVVAVGGDDDLVHVWCLHNDTLTQLSWHDNTIVALSFNNEDDILAVGCSGGSLSLWSLSTSTEVTTAPMLTVSACHDLGVTGLEWSADNRLVSVGQDGLLKLWSLDTDHRQLSMLQTVTAHPTSIMSLWMSQDQTMLVTSSGDKTCKLWSYCDSLRCVTTLGPESSYVTCAAVDTDRGTVVLGVETHVHVYKLPPGHNTSPPQTQHWPDIQQWTADDVQHWLSLLNIDKETLTLLGHINGEVLGSVSLDSLLAAGVDKLVASRIVEEIALICDTNDDGAPNKFVCPITCDLILSPVQCSDGFVYEETAIKEWLVTRRNTSPLTNLELDDTQLSACDTLKLSISAYRTMI